MKFGVVAALLLGATPFVSAPFAHDLIGTKVTWEREIAPIVQARCLTCHSAGGRAPMSLATYEEARPWARAIREEVLTRRMPKWPVVRGYGDFTNDPSLSPFEIALITAWVDGGAPAFASTPAGKPDVAEPAVVVSGSQRSEPKAGREVTLPCTSTTLPAGKAVGLKPLLAKGGSLRMTVTHPDGLQEPLLWVKGFEPEYADAYWLRAPLEISPATRVRMDGSTPCRLTVLLEDRTAQ